MSDRTGRDGTDGRFWLPTRTFDSPSHLRISPPSHHATLAQIRPTASPLFTGWIFPSGAHLFYLFSTFVPPLRISIVFTSVMGGITSRTHCCDKSALGDGRFPTLHLIPGVQDRHYLPDFLRPGHPAPQHHSPAASLVFLSLFSSHDLDVFGFILFCIVPASVAAHWAQHGRTEGQDGFL